MFDLHEQSCIKCHRVLPYSKFDFDRSSNICLDCLSNKNIEITEIECEHMPEIKIIIDGEKQEGPNNSYNQLIDSFSGLNKTSSIMEANDYDYEYNRIVASNMIMLNESDFIFPDVIRTERLINFGMYLGRINRSKSVTDSPPSSKL